MHVSLLSLEAGVELSGDPYDLSESLLGDLTAFHLLPDLSPSIQRHPVHAVLVKEIHQRHQPHHSAPLPHRLEPTGPKLLAPLMKVLSALVSDWDLLRRSQSLKAGHGSNSPRVLQSAPECSRVARR